MRLWFLFNVSISKIDCVEIYLNPNENTVIRNNRKKLQHETGYEIGYYGWFLDNAALPLDEPLLIMNLTALAISP